MKTLLKTLTMFILIVSYFTLNGQPANKMTYIDYKYGVDGKYSDTLIVDIDLLISNNWVNKRLADSIVNWWPENMIVDTLNNYRILVREFGIKWTATEVRDLIQGSYNGYDTLKVAFFNLAFGNYYTYRKYQYELILRLSKELDGAMANKVDSLCFAKLKGGSGNFVYGYLTGDYNATTNTAYLKNINDSTISRVVEFNTVAKYTFKLAEHFSKANE